MLTVFDVAKYILNREGSMSAMKLQKLVYYSQAWSLAWDEAVLFPNRIEAWANGPVVRSLYQHHRGQFLVNKTLFTNLGDARKVTGEAKKTIDAVLKFYGGRSPNELSQLTHRESPWREAREGLAPGERGRAEISRASMAEYYGSLIK